MIINKPFIDEVITMRKEENDPVKKIAIRNKASPINVWGNFKPFTIKYYNSIYTNNIDGVKLRFKHVTLTINGRHKSY